MHKQKSTKFRSSFALEHMLHFERVIEHQKYWEAEKEKEVQKSY